MIVEPGIRDRCGQHLRVVHAGDRVILAVLDQRRCGDDA
jgi:hypothetical protein